MVSFVSRPVIASGERMPRAARRAGYKPAKSSGEIMSGSWADRERRANSRSDSAPPKGDGEPAVDEEV